jgi:hypothetical protein
MDVCISEVVGPLGCNSVYSGETRYSRRMYCFHLQVWRVSQAGNLYIADNSCAHCLLHTGLLLAFTLKKEVVWPPDIHRLHGFMSESITIAVGTSDPTQSELVVVTVYNVRLNDMLQVSGARYDAAGWCGCAHIPNRQCETCWTRTTCPVP